MYVRKKLSNAINIKFKKHHLFVREKEGTHSSSMLYTYTVEEAQCFTCGRCHMVTCYWLMRHARRWWRGSEKGEGRRKEVEGTREKRLRLTCKCVPHVYQRRNSIFELLSSLPLIPFFPIHITHHTTPHHTTHHTKTHYTT